MGRAAPVGRGCHPLRLVRFRPAHDVRGGGGRGAESRVPQVDFCPDWSRHTKAAPFWRNDFLLDSLPVSLVIFPSTVS